MVHDYTMSIDVLILEFVLARMKLWVQLGARIEAGMKGVGSLRFLEYFCMGSRLRQVVPFAWLKVEETHKFPERISSNDPSSLR